MGRKPAGRAGEVTGRRRRAEGAQGQCEAPHLGPASPAPPALSLSLQVSRVPSLGRLPSTLGGPVSVLCQEWPVAGQMGTGKDRGRPGRLDNLRFRAFVTRRL